MLADPFGIPAQSAQVLFGVIPVVPPEQTLHWSMLADPLITPAQSRQVLLGGIPVVPPEHTLH